MLIVMMVLVMMMVMMMIVMVMVTPYENRMTHGVCHTMLVWDTQREDEAQHVDDY